MRFCIIKRFFLIYAIALLAFTGCASLVEKTGKILDGSGFAEKTIAVYRAADVEIQEVQNKAGERSVIIMLEQFPTMKIRGSTPDEQGEFSLASLDYLGGNSHGWNEYRLELSGTGNLAMDEALAILSIPHEIEAVQITSGRIRRYDTRITGTEALTSLRNRRERILALAEWMNSGESPAGSVRAGTAPAETARTDFETYWKPILFPEMVSKKNRPQSWQQENDLWVKAEDIRWNTGYTERAFPELLRSIRDSGTMLRDWEEAIDWLYIEYEWNRIAELLSREIHLIRAKK